MLHLVYRIKPSPAAEQDPRAFWAWVQERERWFYDGLDTVVATRWRVRTVGEGVHTLEHTVTFADEAAWGRYRREVAARGRDPAWERRRVEQGHWWTLLDAGLLSDPPVPVGITRGADPLERARCLLAGARRATLVTTDGTTPWVCAVDLVPLHAPLRLLWHSPREARHSRDVESHPGVSGIVPGADGLRFTGTARAVEPHEVADGHEAYHRSGPADAVPVEEFRDGGPRGFYLLHVDRLWLEVDQREVEVDPRSLD
ncbi:pyridoxamine 5'-phosphate oxidase family protein [Saccharothrix syringae]|uniref:Pyridoxamine 5'-phosphate oxidase family protein n=1 Tax=Saccharothrix syringae TaxID=103733 RepID=A0A5Q0H0E8_SACSY|nr:pyridoxamine 5'-phosphate oxidase family protein [Saccharothrix syringae]QFZ19706.1 pyridoxamine 5'-phosphate oxidase family protein [Saccharothrix syringae]